MKKISMLAFVAAVGAAAGASADAYVGLGVGKMWRDADANQLSRAAFSVSAGMDGLAKVAGADLGASMFYDFTDKGSIPSGQTVSFAAWGAMADAAWSVAKGQKVVGSVGIGRHYNVVKGADQEGYNAMEYAVAYQYAVAKNVDATLTYKLSSPFNGDNGHHIDNVLVGVKVGF